MADYHRRSYYQTALLIDEELRSSSVGFAAKVDDSVNLIRCCVLRILTYFSSAVGPESSSTIATDSGVNLEWGFKFFCSSSGGNKLQERLHFKEFNLKSFEEFEAVLDARLNRPFAGLGSSSSIGLLESKTVRSNLFPNLRSAIERLMHEFPRKRFDMISPVKAIRRQSSLRQSNKSCRRDEQSIEEHKFVFIVAKCPNSLEDMQALTECDCKPQSLLNSILLQRICQEFSEVRQLRLFWINIDSESSGDLLVVKLLGQALEQINGGVVLPGSILNLGSSNTTHIQTLLKGAPEMSAFLESGKKDKEMKEGTLVLPAPPMFSFTSSVHECLKSVKHQKGSHAGMLDACITLDKEGAAVYQVMLEPLLHPTNFQSDALKNESTVENSENAEDSLGVLASKSLSLFHAVAIFSGSVIPLLPLQKELAYIVTAAGDRSEVAADLNFDDLVKHLALSGQILLVVSGSSSSSSSFSSSFGFLHPLTSSSATLAFFSTEKPLSHDALLKSLCLGGRKTASPRALSTKDNGQGWIGASEVDQHRLTSVGQSLSKQENQLSCPQVSTTMFNPVVMESWFLPECIAETSDSLISAISRDVENTGAELNLLSQLSRIYHDQDPSSSRTTFRNIPSKSRCFTRLVSDPTGLPNESATRSNFGSKSCDFVKRTDHSSPQVSSMPQLSPQVSSMPQLSPQKSSRHTPVKANRKTPRKTPRKFHQHSLRKTPNKTSRRTPRKTLRSPRKLMEAESSKTLVRKTSSFEKPPSIPAMSAVASHKGTALRRHKSLRSCDVDRRRSAGSSIVTSRTALILLKSREALERKKRSELEEEELARAVGSDIAGGGINKRLSADQITTTGWQELYSVDELLVHLKKLYNKVVEGEGSPLIGAKSIFSSALQYFRNLCDETAMTLTCTLIKENLCLTSYGVKEKYKGRNDTEALECKFREFQVQVCLQFELSAETVSEDFSEDQAEQLASMLSSVAIVKGGNFLSSYLNNLLEDYLDSSARLLCGIFEHLGRAVPAELKHLQSPDPNDDEHNSLPPPSTQQTLSVPSVTSDGTELTDNTRPQRRSFYRHPTFNQLPMKQIQLNLEPNKLKSKMSEVSGNNNVGHRRSARIASASVASSQPAAGLSKSNELTHDSEYSVEVTGVRRTLFNWSSQSNISGHTLSLPSMSSQIELLNNSDKKACLRSPEQLKTPKIKAHHVLKTKRVSETPAHRLGCNTVLHKMQRLRKQANVAPTEVDVVEESPMKESCPAKTVSCGSGNFRHHVSFYRSTSTAPQRNAKYKRLEERMTQQVLSPNSAEKSKLETTRAPMSSPRRITARVLFGLSPSPCKNGRVLHDSSGVKNTPEFTSPVRGSGSKNNKIHLNSTKNLDSLGVTFLNSPSKPSMDVLRLLDLTSPSKNTRLQARLGLCGNSTVEVGFRRSLMSKLASPAKGDAPKLQEYSPATSAQMTELHNKMMVPERHTQICADFVSPSKRKPAVLTKPDSSVSDEGQRHVGPPSSSLSAGNSISSPIKITTVCTSAELFDSPAKSLRFKAKCSSSASLLAKKPLSQLSTDSNYMSPIKHSHIPFTQPDFTSPAKNTRLQLWRQSGDKGLRDEVLFDFDPKPLTNVDLQRSASLNRSSPTFGPCKRHLLTDSSSPVFKSRTVCTNKLQTMSQVETAVVGKARKRLHMSPDCRI